MCQEGLMQHNNIVQNKVRYIVKISFYGISITAPFPVENKKLQEF